MIFLLPSFAFFAAAAFFVALMMNLVRKNTTLVALFMLQSLAITLALILLAYSEAGVGLLWAALLTFMVKVIMAPVFLSRMIKKYNAYFSAASYLNTPLSLVAIAAIMAFVYSFVSPELAQYGASSSMSLLFGSIFVTLFLMVNRRGALAEVIGILSLENSVVLLAAFLGLHHSFALEFAIAFDIAVWVAIATGFLSMMYRQFGAIDSATLKMTNLTEE